MDLDYFPSLTDVASSSVVKSHRQQIKVGPIPTTLSIDDHLLALRARIKPLRFLGEDLLKAAIWAQGALWPGTEPNKNIQDLAADLHWTEARVRDWRHS